MDEEKETPTKRRSTVLAKFITGPIITLQLFAYISSVLVLAQYGYYAFHKVLFPHDNSTTETQFTCETNFTTPRYFQQVLIQQATSKWSLYLTLASGLPSIFLTIIYGSYSDRFGRKTFLLIPLIGALIRTCFYWTAIYFEWNLYLFIVFALIEGFSGAQFGPVTIAYAIAADLTSDGKIRTFAIAMMEVCAGFGVLTGMLSSGYLIRGLGFLHPFTISAAIIFIDILLVLFVLPETKPPTKEGKNVPILQYLKNSFSFYITKEKTGIDKRKTYILCILVFFFAAMANLGRAHVDVLYELNAPFCWNAVQIGVFGMLRTGVMNLIGLPLIRLLQNCIEDETIAIIGAISGTLCMVLEGFAPNSIALYLVVAVGVGGVIPLPVTRGMMSRMTSSEKQGSLLSGLGSMSSICNLLGTVSANGIYAATVGTYRGLVYFVMAAYYTVAMVLLIVLKSKPGFLRRDTYVLEQHVNYKDNIISTKMSQIKPDNRL